MLIIQPSAFEAPRGQQKQRATPSLTYKMSVISGSLPSYPEPTQIFDVAEKEFGGVDIVVNNAGIMSLASVATTDDAMLDRTIAVNGRIDRRL